MTSAAVAPAVGAEGLGGGASAFGACCGAPVTAPAAGGVPRSKRLVSTLEEDEPASTKEAYAKPSTSPIREVDASTVAAKVESSQV